MDQAAAAASVSLQQGSKWYAVFVCVFASLGGLYFGYDLGASGGVLVMSSFLTHFSVGYGGNRYEACAASTLPQNWVDFTTTYMVVYYVGCMVGAYLGGVIADKRGRRAAIFSAALLYCIGNVILLVTGKGNHAMALLARVIQGLGVGNSSFSMPLFGAEMAPKELRGMLSGFMSMSVTTGTLTAGLIGYGLQDWANGWRTTVSVATIFPVVLMLGIFTLPESPRWLYQYKGRQAAEASLARLRRTDDVGDELKTIGDVIDQVGTEEASWKDVFDPSVRRRVLIAMALQALQQMTGVTIIFAYGAQIFNDVLGNGIIALLIFQATGFLTTIPTMYWVDKVGRRKLLLYGGFGMILSHLMTGILSSIGCHTDSDGLRCSKGAGWAMIIATAFFVFCFSISWGPITWIYPAEIFPLKVRARAVSLSSFSNWAMVAVMIVAPKLIPYLHVNGTFFLFAGLCIGGNTFVYFFCPETKNLALEDIERLFSAHRSLDVDIQTPAEDRF
ncbi:unnamed protein product [Aphanomyces euteiches]